ncbi:hypothetical protein FA15DRAFT_708528 [Coprinopsis marcescibilis]|uniref:Transmembrane protein n=1 Tax=Coprinopsis marcescibilis TaxID=230819 RepID=A0A5C3KI84_COPMA|nr:hypothetical protein FA15DRAFT_708528 [Coprinopsis marcescibilis]
MTEFRRSVVIDDTDPRISYSDGWTRASGATNNHNGNGNFGAVYQNTLHTTTVSGANMSFTFTGISANIFGTNDPVEVSPGVFDPDIVCIVDGMIVPKWDPFPFPENNWLFCNFDQLSEGEHTVRLQVITQGRPFWFDRIIYRPIDVVENETMMINQDDSDINYTGEWGSLGDVAHHTGTMGGSFVFPFFGTRLTLVSMLPVELAKPPGQAVYIIDGGEAIPFTVVSPTGGISEYVDTTFETTTLPQARHMLRVTYLGPGGRAPLVLDHILVENGSNRRDLQPPVLSDVASGTGSDTVGGPTATPMPKLAGGTDGPPVGIITGGILGGLALVLLMFLALCYVRRRAGSSTKQNGLENAASTATVATGPVFSRIPLASGKNTLPDMHPPGLRFQMGNSPSPLEGYTNSANGGRPLPSFLVQPTSPPDNPGFVVTASNSTLAGRSEYREESNSLRSAPPPYVLYAPS